MMADPRSSRSQGLGRRALLGGFFGLWGSGVVGCRRRKKEEPGRPTEPLASPWVSLDFDGGRADPPGSAADGEQRAFLRLPASPGASEASSEAPLLVALHGRGESGQGLDVGARGWRDFYAVDALFAALGHPPLSAADLGGFVEPGRLQALNASLAARPFEGLALACPYTPDLRDKSEDGARGFAAFVADRLLPEARRRAGLRASRARTGIDGVSMGGRLALLVGLSRPDVFGSVGALQPAIREAEAKVLAGLARRALDAAGGKLSLSLVSSEGDPFLPAVRALSAALDGAGVPHRLVVGPGPHDYAWNRGAGGAEMLLFHERALRGLPPP